jgi:DNA recombination protein RmuC
MEAIVVVLLVLLTLLLIAGMAVLAVVLMGLSKRISIVEQSQNQIGKNINTMRIGLAETDTITKGIKETASVIQTALSRAQEDLVTLQAQAKARQELEFRTAESVRRLEGVIAGIQTKGAAGENIIDIVFAQLPSDWQVRNFRVGDKTVEFGLRLPNNLVLPIDSKWTATNLLDRFLSTDDIGEQQSLKSEIANAVLARAKEVRKYIDPNMTLDFAIAVVPDAIYDLCASAQVEAFRMNVVLISYGLFVPYLLLVFQTVLKTCQSIDLQRLNSYLESVQSNIEALQKELEGRFSRAITMLTNSRGEMSAHLSRIRGGLTSLQMGAGVVPDLSQIPDRAA